MPSLPYVIALTVRDSSDALVSGVTVTCTNESTGETTTSIATNGSGQTLIDLANLTSGYSDGDWLQFQASGTGSNGQVLKFKAVAYVDGAQINAYDMNYEV